MYARHWHRAPAICDRCQFQVRQGDLRPQMVEGRITSLMVCAQCEDVDNPQWRAGRRPVVDPQRLPFPRKETVVPVPAQGILWGGEPIEWGAFNNIYWGS